MAYKVKLIPSKTYKTEANLERAISKFPDTYRYMIVWNEAGRCYPVFIGNESFNVVHAGFIVVG